MSVIEGAGSPWSYLSASILGKEAAEFGAAWHGSSWTEESILAKLPWDMASLDVSPSEVWEWRHAVPNPWCPTYTEQDETKVITLHLYTGLEMEHIYRATDTYQSGRYECETKVEVLSVGGGRYIH